MNMGDTPLTAAATFTGRGFSGPREVTVPPRASGAYPLTFHPTGAVPYAASLELAIQPSGERNMYLLQGRGSEPLAEGHVVLECQARDRGSH